MEAIVQSLDDEYSERAGGGGVQVTRVSRLMTNFQLYSCWLRTAGGLRNSNCAR